MVYEPKYIQKEVFMPKKYNKQESKRRILSACVKLFIEKGYHSTTLAEILKESNTTSSTFQNIFRSKDGVLLDLTEFMFDSQFAAARNVNEKNLPPIYIYAAETSIQMTLAELNENLRDIYVEAYSNERTAEYIFERTSTELTRIFSEYNPNLSECDFYELEIGTAGIMRNYMAKRCDKYFTLEKKLECFLNMSMSAYNVPEGERKKVIEFIMGIDIKTAANQIMQKLFNSLAMHFEFELGEKEKNQNSEV